MKGLPHRGQVYIWATIVVGLGLTVWHLPHLNLSRWPEIFVAAFIASVAQVLRVEGATAHSSYEISWVLFGFTFVLYGAPETLFVILVSHVVEGVWHQHQKRWYIFAFNVMSFAIVVSAADLLQKGIRAISRGLGWEDILGIVAATALFTILNHLMIGLVLWLARGEPLSHSGVMGRLTLVIDFTTFALGAAAALMWMIHPVAIVLILAPLYLIYSTLRVPALERQTQVDPKTGLFNARYLSEALDKELARADRYDRPLIVAMADLDLLRNINNTYGHLAGDTALIGVARLLRTMVREYDIVARFGGEEFGILMPETTYEQAAPRIEAIRAAIEAAEFEISTSVTPLKVTMSFGMASRHRFGLTANEIVHSADLAVYQAKLAGRNRICHFAGENVADVVGIAPESLAAPDLAPAQAPAPSPTPPAPKLTPASPTPPAPKLTPASAPTRETRSHAGAVAPRPTWAVTAYVVSLLIVAVGLWGWGMMAWPPQTIDAWALVTFVVLAAATEWLAMDIYVRDTSVSTSVAPLVATAILFGPSGAILVSVALAAVAMLRHHSPWNRFFFNSSNHLVAAMLSAAVARGGSLVLGSQPLMIAGVTGMLATSVVYLSSTGLLAGIVDVSSGQPLQRVWMERFRWLWPYYLGLGVVACALIYSYQFSGLLGVAVTLVPLLVLRQGQAQYLDHTKALVSQLRRINTEIQQKSDEISGLNDELLLSLSRAIDLRDPDVQDHSQNVARYSTLIAQEMGLPPERVELVRKAGLLHDIGKLGIPETILFKPSRLTPQEYDDVKQHVTLGAEMVNSCHSLHMLVPIIRHHHERYDGLGYPDRLQGHAVPLEARIISVADTIEAMAADRPYRRGQPADLILKEISDNAGTQFDPQIVNALRAVIDKHGIGIIVNSARDDQAQSARTPAGVAADAFNTMIGHMHSREARRYRTVVEDQTDLICRFRPNGTLTFVNDVYCHYFGKSNAELLGKTFIPLIPEVDQPVIMAHMARLGRETPVATVEHRVILPDGAIRWQQWTDRAIFNAQGEIVEYQSVGRDITEQKLSLLALEDANQKLERRNQQLAHILEVGNSLRLSPDLEEGLQQIVECIHQALGFEQVTLSLAATPAEPARLVAQSGPAATSVESANGWANPLSLFGEKTTAGPLLELFRIGSCYFIPGEATNWDRESPAHISGWRPPEAGSGTWQPGDKLVVPLTLRSNEVAGLIVVDQPTNGQRPITEIMQGLEIFANQAIAAIEHARVYSQLQRELGESQRMDAALRASENRYRLLAENITDVIWVRDLTLRYVFLSPSIQKLRGYLPEEAMAQTLEETLTSQSAALKRQFLNEMVATARRNGPELRRFQARRLTLEMRRRDGTTVWTESQISFLMDEQGRPMGILGVTRDISDPK